jgi:hypothetical protein
VSDLEGERVRWNPLLLASYFLFPPSLTDSLLLFLFMFHRFSTRVALYLCIYLPLSLSLGSLRSLAPPSPPFTSCDVSIMAVVTRRPHSFKPLFTPLAVDLRAIGLQTK